MMSFKFLVLFTIAATLVWCGFVWTYHQLFAWAEWVPGINIVYFPHGLRMILVILFAEAGAFGNRYRKYDRRLRPHPRQP